MGSFSGYHPAVIFLYFVLILVFTMFSMHPYFLCCSLLCGFLCSFLWGQGKAIKRNLRMTVPLVMLGIVINPLFTQRGSTILFYLNDAAVTLEAVLYGLAAAMLFSSVLVWIQCWGMVMGIDQFICLFGRVLPVLGLLLSITFPDVSAAAAQICSGEGWAALYGKGRRQPAPDKKAPHFQQRALHSDCMVAGSRDRDVGLDGGTGLWAEGPEQLYHLPV